MIRKRTLASLCIIAVLVGAGVTYAAVSWSQIINWDYPTVKSFSVSNPTTVNYGTLAGDTTKTEVYTITNDGNVPVTVNAAATATGASVSWDKTTDTIPVAGTTTFTLTLTITGAGSCTVTFTAS